MEWMAGKKMCHFILNKTASQPAHLLNGLWKFNWMKWVIKKDTHFGREDVDNNVTSTASQLWPAAGISCVNQMGKGWEMRGDGGCEDGKRKCKHNFVYNPSRLTFKCEFPSLNFFFVLVWTTAGGFYGGFRSRRFFFCFRQKCQICIASQMTRLTIFF